MNDPAEMYENEEVDIVEAKPPVTSAPLHTILLSAVCNESGDINTLSDIVRDNPVATNAKVYSVVMRHCCVCGYNIALKVLLEHKCLVIKYN